MEHITDADYKMAEDHDVVDNMPLAEKILKQYTPEQFSMDIADYILAEGGTELQKILKEAWWWKKYMMDTPLRDWKLQVSVSQTMSRKISDIGEHIFTTFLEQTDGK